MSRIIIRSVNVNELCMPHNHVDVVIIFVCLKVPIAGVCVHYGTHR